jgi:hypothetical protein
MLSFCPIPITHSLDRGLSIPDALVDPWQQVARRVRSTPEGGEPHYKCAAAKSGKGLSRESLKDIFAAAPCSRGTIEGSFKPRVEPACVPGRRVYPSAISCNDFLAPTCVRATTRNATPLRTWLHHSCSCAAYVDLRSRENEAACYSD